MSDKNIITQSAHKFTEHYDENPLTALLLTTLSLVVPQIAIGKEAIDRAVTKIQQERFQTLIDELATGEKYLTPEIIETEEFIHSFVVIYRVVMNTYQRQKIRFFAQILLSAVEKDELASDRFEEFVRILEDMTYRELELLVLLNQYETNNSLESIKETDSNGNILKEETENDAQRAQKFWDTFMNDGCKIFKCEPELLISVLTGLSRTGLYETFAGRFIDYDGQGKITILFKEFTEWIKFESDTDSILYKD
ncbi:MAG: hypothetical protein Phog2KO_08400 [Phototrophicaceae bacterium]